MVCKARLSCRSPERLSRCLVTCPEEAGIGLAPARAAKAASERSRPACDQLTRSWMRWAVERSARTVMRCSSDLAGRSRSPAQCAIWRLVASPRSSARSSSGAPTIRALSWLTALTLATQALWRVVSSTRSASRWPRRRGARGWSWARASRAARTASRASLLAPVRRRWRRPACSSYGSSLCRWPGRVGLEDTARRFCDGSQPLVGQAAHQASKPRVRSTSGTTADNSSPRQPDGCLNRCESCCDAGRRSLTRSLRPLKRLTEPFRDTVTFRCAQPVGPCDDDPSLMRNRTCEDSLRSRPAGRCDDAAVTHPGPGLVGAGVTVGSSVLEAVLGAWGLGLLPAGGRLVREAAGGGLAQQGSDNAPHTRQVVAACGAGLVAVGASWRRLALVALAGVLVLSLLVALAGAGPLGSRTPAPLLVALGAPVLAAGVLAGAGALAGAVGGLLAGPRAVDALAAGVVRLLGGAAAAGAGPPDGRGHRSPTS